MATKEVDIGETSLTDRQILNRLKETLSQLANGVLTGDQIQALNEHRDPFKSVATLRDVNLNDQVEKWRHHFKTLYRMNPDFSDLYIPQRQEGFDRLVIVPKGLTHRKWVETARTIHKVCLNNSDLYESVEVNDRTPKGKSYGVWIRDRQEADEELNRKAATDLKTLCASGLTLIERLVAGTGYLFEKMCHMDVENVTLCTGSHSSDGRCMPGVYWDSRRFEVSVGWCFLTDPSTHLRSRAVVS